MKLFILEFTTIYRIVPAMLAGLFLLPNALLPCGPSSGEPEAFLFSEIPARSYGRLCIDSRLLDRSAYPAACGAKTREEENAKEWAAYLGISADDARKGVYTPQGSKAFARALAEKPAAKTYLDFARRVERIQVSTFGWDWEIENEQKGSGRAEAEKMIPEIIEKAANVKDSFLSPRYRLLKARLLLRAGRLAEILAVPVPESPGFAKGQILRLRAGASLRLKNPVSAAIQTILAYEASPSSGAADDFRYLQLQEADFRKASASNLSAKQKALLYYLSGIHMGYNGTFALAVEDLENFWDADPKSPAADSLLLKTVALMEEEALPNLIFGQRVELKSHRTIQEKLASILARFFPSLRADPVLRLQPETQKAADRLLRFLRKHEGETQNRPLWNAAMAYTAYVAGDPDSAARLLEKKDSNPALEARRRIILLLARIEKERRVSAESEADFVSLLPVLASPASALPRYSEYDQKGRPSAELMLYRVMATAYGKSGAPEKAVLASYMTDTFEWYPAARLDEMKSQDLVRLRDYMKSPDNSPIDPVLKKKTQATPALVADRLAAAYAREGRYADAERELQNVTPRKITLEFTGKFGPFDASWETRPDPGRNAWNRRSYFAEMARLTAEIDRKPNDPASAKLYMRRGIGAYNASHFGKWWILMRDYWSSSHTFDRKYWEKQLQLARNDFEKAASLSSDREFTAQAVFYSAAASFALNSPREWTEDKPALGKEEKAAYTRLAHELGDTRFVQTIGSTCATLSEFLSN